MALKLLFGLYVLAASQCPQPYKRLNGGGFVGPRVVDSPDPLISYAWKDGVNRTELQIYSRLPQSSKATKNFTFHDDGNITVTGTGNLTVDFGLELAAWLEVDVSEEFTDPGSTVMAISEYRGIRFWPDRTRTPKKCGNTLQLYFNDEYYDGVRFGFFMVKKFDKPFNITEIRAMVQIKPSNYVGSFKTDDSLLNRIWYTGAYTVRSTMQGAYFGTELLNRGDRFTWTGDAHTIQACAMEVFDNPGFIWSNLNRTSCASCSQGIRIYAMYWVLSLSDYWRKTKDKKGVVALSAHAAQHLDDALAAYGKNPDLRFMGGDERVGDYFENPSIAESQRAYGMATLWALRAFGELAEQTGQDAYANYTSIASQLVQDLKRDPDWHTVYGQFSAMMAANAGILTSEEAKVLVSRLFGDEALPMTNVMYTPFNQFFLVRGLFELNETELAHQSINLTWGGQIQYGATTFFEIFHPFWNDFIKPNDPVPQGPNGYTTLCHAWSSGVTALLTQYTLGVRAAGPGYDRWVFRPQHGHLSFIEGNVSTPYGIISVYCNILTGIIRLRIPPRTIASVGVPAIYVRKRAFQVGDKFLLAHDNGPYLVLPDLSSGSYIIRFQGGGRFPRRQAQHRPYPVQFLGNDTSTRGNWKGKYGSSGYLMFSTTGPGNDTLKLPSFMTRLAINISQIVLPISWANKTDDVRGLESSKGRFLGAAATHAEPTFGVDLELKEQRTFQLSIYFVDWEPFGRDQMVQIFDLFTGESLVPWRRITSFESGVYLKWNCSQSVRVRLNNIAKENSVMSALFID